MSMAKIIMATDPAERQWYEDQLTVNLYARRLMCGNSRVIVVDGGDAGCQGERASDLTCTVAELRAIVAKENPAWRVLVGAELFTPRDNERPYKADRA